ncbi:cell envelope-related function transcriptional attenuator common domain-containing protein [Halobacillus karajensis]|uniref:DUF1510 family protein n=1 Tax=Halobacillus karajensis TaxID=195088 RepID=UPI0008A72AAC|nr:DUF1510 family protein [Halobacillus karajensis]SEI04370.1 cell envelope-related function transcriptional attenuator common domain-containing protein [Halobacillus karajensis]
MGKKVVLFILTACTVLILGIISYVFQFTTTTTSNIVKEIDRNGKFGDRQEEISLMDGDPVSVLVMGMDTRAGKQGGQTDTLVLLTINPDSKSVKMVSIPRDTYTKIEGGIDKINSAYGIGNVEMTMNSVENLLNVPVDYYIEIDMKGFTGIVDSLGGVEVNNDFEFRTDHSDFTDENVHFPKGKLTLDGKEALLYARMRKLDPRGDFGRQKRQRQVIESILHKGSNLSSVTKFGEIAQVVGKNVNTNFNLFELWMLQSNYKEAQENITSYEIAGEDKTIKGTYYYMPDKKELDRISTAMKNHLEMNDQDPYAGEEKKQDSESRESKEGTSEEAEEMDGEESRNDQEESNEDKEKEETDSIKGENSKGAEERNTEGSQEKHDPPNEQKETETFDSEEKPVENSGDPNVAQVITKNWSPVPTSQENYSGVSFEKGSLDWEEMTAAISKGAGLQKNDMIVWWVSGEGLKKVIGTVTDKAQTNNYRVYVSWVDGAGYKPTKVEVLHENDQKR